MIDAPENQTLPAAKVDDAPAPTSALLELLPHVLRTLRREPALAVSLLYLLVAMAGIFYNFAFYREFDVPVLTLSQIGDFLVAGIQEPMALVLVATTFPLCWVFDFINLRGRRRRAKEMAQLRASPTLSAYQRGRMRLISWVDSNRWYRQLIYLVLIVLYGWMFVGAYANHRSEEVKRGDALKVRVWMNDGEAVQTASGEATWTYLGAIAQYVFLYDARDGRAEILPVNAVARIEPEADARRRKSGVAVAPIP